MIDPKKMEGPAFKELLLKFDESYEGARKAYFMEHKTATPCPEKPLGRTIYVTCVPPWATAQSLERVFSENGAVQSVFLEKRPNPGPSEDEEDVGLSRYLHPLPETRVGFGFKCAYVVFKNAAGMKNALKTMNLTMPRVLSTTDAAIVTGVLKWKREYNTGILADDNVDALKEEMKSFTDDFDRAKDAVVARAEEEAEPDEDGWVTVSRHTSKKPVGGRSEKAQARLKMVAEKKRKRKELDNFYKFQMLDAKLQRIEELKSKFESDKERQLKLKQDRKFKPFK